MSAIREAVLNALTVVDVEGGVEVRFPSGAVMGRTTVAGEFELAPEYRATATADPGVEVAAPAESEGVLGGGPGKLTGE